MKINPCYTLCKIENTCYLLPFGQGIADHSRGVRINESGAFLWKLLPNVTDRKELEEHFYSYYHAENEEEQAILAKDLDGFLFLLTSLGIITYDWEQTVSDSLPSIYLQIGPLCLHLIGDDRTFPKEFKAFQTTPQAMVHLTIELRTVNPPISENGSLLIRNEELSIWEQSDHYRILFPSSRLLTEARLKKDGSFACIYHEPSYTEELTTSLFHAIRLLYLYTARMHGCYALHSSSIRYHEKAWLFSGHSGMGKSTHTSLWQELFDTPVLNGDLNLLAFKDNEPVVYGIPWCGTSGIFVTDTFPLGGIILLARSEQDSCEELSPDKKALLILQRLISPAWTKEMLEQNLQFTSLLSQRIDVCRLKCTKNPSAARTMKCWIDNHIFQKE